MRELVSSCENAETKATVGAGLRGKTRTRNDHERRKGPRSAVVLGLGVLRPVNVRIHLESLCRKGCLVSFEEMRAIRSDPILQADCTERERQRSVVRCVELCLSWIDPSTTRCVVTVRLSKVLSYRSSLTDDALYLVDVGYIRITCGCCWRAHALSY